MCFASCLVTLGIGMFLFAMTVTKDIQCLLHRLNKKAKHRRNECDAKKGLSEFIELFPEIKQLSKKHRISWNFD